MIVSSTFQLDNHDQRDGRCYCKETHVLDVGAPVVRWYRTMRTGVNHQEIANVYALQLLDMLQEEEMRNTTDSGEPFVTPVHQTEAEFLVRVWRRIITAYEGGDKLTYHRLIWRMWQAQQDGQVTSNELRLTFNQATGRSLTTAQWNTFVTDRLVPIKDRYLAFINEGAL